MKELASVVGKLRLSLDEIEAALGGEDVPPKALEAFKVTLDDVRTSLLAFVAASGPSEYTASVRRFRLRRAAQICQGVLTGVHDGTIGPDTPGLADFRSIVEETRPRVEDLLKRL